MTNSVREYFEEKTIDGNTIRHKNIPKNFKGFQDNLDIYKTKIVSDELHDFVFDMMPKNLNKLQKALFIYFKLCSVLRYDDKCYNRSDLEDHKDINLYKQITPQNPSVICADFSAIYAVMLKEIGIKPKIYVIGNISGKPVLWSGKNFPMHNAHIWVEFDFDGTTIRADSTPSILSGDLSLFKYGVHKILSQNKKDTGLICTTRDQLKKVEFEKDVYDAMQSAFFNSNVLVSSELQKRLQNYAKAGQINSRIKENIFSVPFEVRIALMFKIVQNVNLHDLELAQYLILVSDKLFDYDEDIYNNKDGIFEFMFARNNKIQPPKTEVLFSYKTINEKGKLHRNYCILDGKQKPKFLTKQQLTKKFVDHEFEKIKEENTTLGLQI